MNRRTFIKLTAVTGTSATLASCGNPEHQLVRFVPEDDLVPGIAEWKPSICPACQAGCGVHVRVMEADAEVTRNGQAGIVRMNVAKKLEGNPAHPISQGALCARGQAAIQMTYHPDRIAGPIRRIGPRGSGQFRATSWDDGLAELTSRLDGLASTNNQNSLAFLTRRRRNVRHDLIARFLQAFGAPPAIEFELFSDDVLRRANNLSFGHAQLPTFDLARSRYLISFGADFLGTWNSPVAQNLAYGQMRQGASRVRATFVQVEARMSQTGANADEWVPIRPGTEGVLALGLAHVIMAAKLRDATAAGRAGAQIDDWASGLADYEPTRVQEITGVATSRIERLARDLAYHRPAVTVIGGAPLAHTNGLFHALAVNALNALLESIEQPGGVFFMPQGEQSTGRVESAPNERNIAGFAASILAADRPSVQTLIIDDANPVFATPRAWRVREALEKVPFIASFGSFVDETSSLADLILPDHSFLESWVDAAPEAGALIAVKSVAGPAMRPLLQTRATADVLLDVARRLQRPLTAELPWKSYDDALKAMFGKLPGTSPEEVWSTAQRQGGWWVSSESGSPKGQPARSAAALPSPLRPARGGSSESKVRIAARFSPPEFDGAASEFPFHFLPYPSHAFFDGSLAHLPWLQELPDPLTSGMWSTWLEINPKTAARLGISQGDRVEIASRHGSIRAPALISPGIAPDIVAMPVGQGHETFTRYATGRGANPIRILAPATEPETGALAWAATRVRIARVGDAEKELILFAGEMREKPHEDAGR
jgi:anaerobic selenocysteine-containing dehydrogenase